MQKQKSLMALFVPIALETLLMMLTGMVDTVMLSSVGDAAVGAVGTDNTYLSIFLITFNVIASGLVAVVTQFLGAGHTRAAGQTLNVGLCFNAVVGGLVSLFLLTQTDLILNLAGIASGLLAPARTYMKIVGGFCFVQALVSVYSSYLRAFGFARQSLLVSVGANGVNLILNAFFPFYMGWGVAGVALATVLSRIGNLLVCWVYVRLKIHTEEGGERMRRREILRQIVRIGLPSALETALYCVASAMTVRFLNQMDTEGLNVTAKVYASQLANFSYCGAAALSQANGLLTGWQVGAGKLEECYHKTNRVAVIAILSSIAIAALFASLANPLLGLFTMDRQLIRVASQLMIIDIALEAGRAANLVYGQSLKVSGDSVYPSAVAAVFMYLVMVSGSWLLGIRMKLWVQGVYVAMAADEGIRALMMWLRWRSGKWRTKGIITRKSGG